MFYDRIKCKIPGWTGYFLSFTVIFITIQQLSQLRNLLYYTILYYTILYYTILYYTILYYAILYYTMLYYTILYYAILYYTMLYYRVDQKSGDKISFLSFTNNFLCLGSCTIFYMSFERWFVCGNTEYSYFV